MNFRPLRLLACWSLLVASATVRAGTIHYPAAAPLLSFEMPDGWKTEQLGGEIKTLECLSDDGSGVVVEISTIDDAELVGDFRNFAKAAVQSSKRAQDAKLVESGDDTVGGNLPARFARFTLRNGDAPVVLRMFCVSAGGGKSVLFEFIVSPDEPDGRKERVRKLLASIKLTH